MIPLFTVIPSRQSPDTFSEDMDTLLAELPPFVNAANALEQSLQLVATTGTSTTSVSVGTGSKTLVTQAGKAWAVGSFIYIVSAASVANLMIGQVTAYNTTTGSLTANAVTSSGSGTYASWVIGLSAPLGSSATFSGTVTAAALSVDSAYTMTLLVGNPLLQFDANDYIWYDRTNNKMGFSVGGVDRLTIDATDGPQRPNDASSANGLTRKSQVDALTVRASLAEVQAGTDNSKIVTAQTLQTGKMISSASVASTSGAAIDFTGIPSWAKRITVMFNGVSTNGSSLTQVQIGSGSVDTSSYNAEGVYISTSVSSSSSSTTGFLMNTGSASMARYGHMVLTHMGGNLWIQSHVISDPTYPGAFVGAGSKQLSGALDRIRITNVNGTDTFDAGSVSIIWE